MEKYKFEYTGKCLVVACKKSSYNQNAGYYNYKITFLIPDTKNTGFLLYYGTKRIEYRLAEFLNVDNGEKPKFCIIDFKVTHKNTVIIYDIQKGE